MIDRRALSFYTLRVYHLHYQHEPHIFLTRTRHRRIKRNVFRENRLAGVFISDL